MSKIIYALRNHMLIRKKDIRTSHILPKSEGYTKKFKYNNLLGILGIGLALGFLVITVFFLIGLVLSPPDIRGTYVCTDDKSKFLELEERYYGWDGFIPFNTGRFTFYKKIEGPEGLEFFEIEETGTTTQKLGEITFKSSHHFRYTSPLLLTGKIEGDRIVIKGKGVNILLPDGTTTFGIMPTHKVYVKVGEVGMIKPAAWDARAVEPLIRALKDNSTVIRWHAADALGKIGDARAVEPLIQALKDENWYVRWKTAEALGKIGDARAVEPLIQALKDKEWLVREKAAEALGEIGDARAVEPLIQALKDKDSDVREKAAEALGKIKDARAVEPLIQALKDEEWLVREKAAEALGKIGDARAVEPLIQALKDKYSVVREKAADALGKIKDARAVEPLIQALKDEKWTVREKAAYALGEIGDARAVEPLIQALKDKNSDVREKAANALKKIEAKKS